MNGADSTSTASIIEIMVGSGTGAVVLSGSTTGAASEGLLPGADPKVVTTGLEPPAKLTSRNSLAAPFVGSSKP